MGANRILLMNPPIRLEAPPSHIPIGVASIAAVLRRAGHDVHVLDMNGLRLGFDEAMRRLGEAKWDIVAAGGLVTRYAFLKDFFAAVKQAQPQALRVVGGGVCVEPEVVLENMDVDVCVLGEGEHTMRDLAEAGRDRGDWSAIPGLAWRDGNGGVAQSAPRPLEKDLDRFGMPAFDLFPVAAYNRNVLLSGARTEVNIITSRGCPWNCSFCWHIFGTGLRFRGIEAVMEEIRYFREKYRPESILFTDENFTANRTRLVAFCEAMIREGFHRMPWLTSSRADTLDNEVLALMRRAGCYRVQFGVESGCQRVLDSMNKKIRVEEMTATFELCRKNGIIPGGTLIFGMPIEDDESIAETVRFCRKTRMATGLFYATPYPGTAMYQDPDVFQRIMAKYGTKDAFFSALGNATDFVINLTRWSDEEMVARKTRADRQIKYQPLPTMALLAARSVRARGLRRTARFYGTWLAARLRGPART